MSPEANPAQLVALARITNKYQFRSVELWALGALNVFYSRPGAFEDVPTTHPPQPPPVLGAAPSPGQPSLIQLTELAALCERPDLLDAVVGRARLPTFDDQARLPYIEATVREAIRWRPVLPLGMSINCLS